MHQAEPPADSLPLDTVLHGDCLEVMRGLPDNAVSAIVSDPPYALTTGSPRVGFSHCLRYIALQVLLPEFYHLNPKALQAFKFAGITSDMALLHGVKCREDSRVSMPVSSIDLQCDIEGGQPEVNHEGEAARSISEGMLPDIASAQGGQLVSNLALQLRSGKDIVFCKGACSCYRQLGSHCIALDVVVSSAALGNSLLSASFPSNTGLFTDDIGLTDNALSSSSGTSGIVAGVGTEMTAMLTLDMRKRTFKLAPTSSTSKTHFLLSFLGTQAIGASAGAGCLTPPFEAANIGLIEGVTNRASSPSQLLIHSSMISFLAKSIPQKGFMSKEWDNGAIAFSVDLWEEIKRVLKPGAFVLAFGGTRTYHRMVSAMEDAGLEVKDTLAWIHGQGFPKSKNLGNGFGSALKPSHEPICLARKPLAAANLASNVLRWSVGGINVDACRVSTEEDRSRPPWRSAANTYDLSSRSQPSESHPSGRWPPNCLLSHTPACRRVGVTRVKSESGANLRKNSIKRTNTYGERTEHQGYGYKDADGLETVEQWACDESCPVRLLDEQAKGTRAEKPSASGLGGWRDEYVGGETSAYYRSTRYEDAGGPSRFFPCFPADPPGALFAGYCILCNLPLDIKHGIMSEIHQGGTIPCELVNTAAKPSIQNTGQSDFAHTHAQPMLQPKGAGKNRSRSKSAPNVVSTSGSTLATTAPVALSSVWDWQQEHLARSVQSAASLCDSCATSIVQGLVRLWHKQDLTSLPGLDSTTNCNVNILLQNLASCVVNLELQGITPTTVDLTILSGYVTHAINTSIMQARNVGQPEESSQSRSAILVNQDLPILHEGALYKYFPKASRSERQAGCETLPVRKSSKLGNGLVSNVGNGTPGHTESGDRQSANFHPTVKPASLVQWLCRLVVPPGGIVLDCFAGSGTTGVAAIREGFHWLLIEQSEEYCQIARARIAHAQREAAKPAKPAAVLRTTKQPSKPVPPVQPAPIPIATRRKRTPTLPPDIEQLALFA